MKLLLAFALLFGFQARADQMDYSAKAFMTARETGRKTVLQFHADWCPVCVKQNKVISELSGDYKDVTFFKVNFDDERELKKQYGIKGQSTLIFLDGKKEVARSQGVTDRMKLAGDLRKLAGM